LDALDLTMQSALPENFRIALRPGFCWDASSAYLFDIDGTLIRSRDRIHFNAFHQAILDETGLSLSLEGVPLAGNTDSAILLEAFRLAGYAERLTAAAAVAIHNRMAAYVRTHFSELEPEVLPAVPAVLDHLAGRGAHLGLATGNLEAIGWLKMERAGLRNHFRFGGFSDRFADRNQMVGHAAAVARTTVGSAGTVCVVGDTPRDIAAARANQLQVIAVATGHFSFSELAALEPDACVATLADLPGLASAAPSANGVQP